MKKEFLLAFNEVLQDKQLPQEIVMESLEAAMVSAYRKTVNASSAQHVHAKFDLETGKVTIFAEKEVVEDVQDERTEVLLETALKFDPEAELDSIVIVESTPESFGRIAAQTARQVIQQRIREAEREAQFEYFQGQAGEIINGIVQAANAGGITIGLDRKAEGSMPRNHQIRGERFRVHDRVRALLFEVKMHPRGPQIILSRAHKNFLRRLLEDEVPEIYQGLVEIRSIAREPGYRSKVAVFGLQTGIDPVGACVGIRGVRIQAIVRELNDEKIDVIEWNPDPSAFIAKALSPARVTGVYLDESRDTKTATVVVPEDQLSLAIGRDGQNARLAAKLTGWRIDIKSLSEAASDALFKLQNDPDAVLNAEEIEEMATNAEVILAKKSEGRPITPEEYQLLGQIVNRVELGMVDQRQAALEAKRAEEAEAREGIPESAFNLPLEDLGISLRLSMKLTGEGFSTIGELMMQLVIDSDVILAVDGLGPKAMEEIQTTLDGFDFPVVEVPEPVVEEVDGEAEEDVVEQVAAEESEEESVEAADEVAEVEGDEEKAKEPVAEVVAEPEQSFEDLLEESESEEGFDEKAADKTSKTKGKYRQIEYDPELGVEIVRKRRKGDRDEDDWEEF